ncbi:MAG: hypothetical protein AAB289_00890, partial [Chloroflexota bacterium]
RFLPLLLAVLAAAGGASYTDETREIRSLYVGDQYRAARLGAVPEARVAAHEGRAVTLQGVQVHARGEPQRDVEQSPSFRRSPLLP